MLQKLRERMASEKGFTLIELLVVMLIIGILAAIAIPTFFNQKQKASDSSAKESAHSAQVALETYATDNNGSYVGADLGKLQAIEPTVGTGANVVSFPAPAPTIDSYQLRVTNTSTNHYFEIDKTSNSIAFVCQPQNQGGCPNGGNWGG